MERNRLLKRACIPIALVALLATPAVVWAQPQRPGPAALEYDGEQAGTGNETSNETRAVEFVPHDSRRTVLPGGTATHEFRLVNRDGKSHKIDITAAGFGDNRSWSYEFEPSRVVLDGNASAAVRVTVHAPDVASLPTAHSHLVVLTASEKGVRLDEARARTSILLP